MQDRIMDLTIELARKLRDAGMVVYISNSPSSAYGYFSDSLDGKAVYFQIDRLTENLTYSSRCVPSRQYGTGCGLDVTDAYDMAEVTKLPERVMPGWYKRPESDRLTLLEVVHDTNRAAELTSQV